MKSLSIFTLVFFTAFQSFSQEKVKLSGQVRSFYTGKGIVGATIYIESLQKGTSTDFNGYYELMVPQGTFRIQFNHLNMKEEVVTLDITSDRKLDYELKEEVLNLDEITVFSEKANKNVENLDVGKSDIDTKRLNSIPSFMGEPDVIKSLVLLPGVTTVGEGASGFNVRGGSVDQNLIYQDGGYIFNPSHVFGFFSIFNPLIVKKATLYKGGIPAKYGGRLSSVLNVDIDEGDFQDYSFKGSLGLVTSKFAFNGPVIKDKLSILIGGRASYSDWLLNLVDNWSLNQSSAGFQDTNVKLSYLLNEKNKFTYSGYLSHDIFGFPADPKANTVTYFDWTTFNNIITWNHLFTEDFNLKIDFLSGKYSYSIENDEELEINSFNINSNINYQNVRIFFDHNVNARHKINFGAEGTLYRFEPGQQKPTSSNSGIEEIELEHEKSIETALFFEDEFKISEKLSIRGGLRYSLFYNLGPGTDYLYGLNDSKNTNNIIDTVFYKSNELIAQYGGLEPRFNINYKLSASSSLKLSYNRTRQYLHLISNTTAVTPVDLWKTSNLYIPPEIGDQFTIGYFKNFLDNKIETSVELYYKMGENVVDFKNGVDLLMNNNIEADLLSGLSESYGMEVYVNKNIGKTTGWISYTYSRTFRIFDGEYADEVISLGRKFPSNFDKPHDLTLALVHHSNPLLEFGVNFTYSTGRPTTEPQAIYDVSTLTNVFSYSLRNQERIPDYHRLDLSATIRSKPKIDKKWRMSWTFAIYNVYGRENAYSVFYRNYYGSPPSAYKLSVLGRAFPSLMINIEF